MRTALATLTLLVLSGCEFLGGGGGTGGGAGGGGGTAFAKGYVYVRKDDRNLYLADDQNLMSAGRLTTAGSARHPSFSKDGKRVVFSFQSGTDSELRTIATSGGTVSTVIVSTPTMKNLRSPVLSPDGMKVVFTYDVGGSSALGVVNVDSSGFTLLAGGGALSYASPSFLDATTVLAAAGNSTSALTQLEKVDLGTRVATPVTNSLTSGVDALTIVNRVVASPDGTRAAFDGRAAAGANGPRIYVIDLATKAVSRLTDYPADPGANDSFPTWEGSAKVGFSSDLGGNDNLYALPATATNTSGGLKLSSAIEPWYGPN